MMGALLQPARPSPADSVPARGYHAVYRPNGANPCPGCGRSHWLVGRISAECGFCATALPIAGGEAASVWGLVPLA